MSLIKKKKQTIPKKIKLNVWKKYMHPSDKFISQCQTCGISIKAPISIVGLGDLSNNTSELNSYFNTPGYLDISNAEMGHIISEKNGGSIKINNLIPQCKYCNLKLGSKNIIHSQIGQHDLLMISQDNYQSSTDYMNIESIYCLARNFDGKPCQNKILFSNGYCHIHCGKN